MNNRTKGNVKPSNSERASRLLSSNKFLSFSEASKTLSSVYGKNQNESNSAFDCDLSSDFQNIFKHMAKKDAVTKVKALEDFISLCKSKQSEELAKISLYWFRVYRKIANSTEWNMRNLAHMAQYEFLSSLNLELAQQLIRNSSVNVNETDKVATGEISFQNLVTMPAVMWTSCFDAYSQSAESAKIIFQHIIDDSKKIEFLIENYESILNYCVYVIFNKIPIQLFYAAALPEDSVTMFEEHMATICLHGLSSMIEDLLHFYIDNNLDSKSKVFECLEKIFIRLNSEFVKCKGLPGSYAPGQSIESQAKSEKEILDVGELELSKKEKKKLKKEMIKNEAAKNKSLKKNCEFWTFFSSTNDSVRTALFKNLFSLTRLTSFFSDPNDEGEMSYFEKLSISARLWFKLYKNNFFDMVFKSFVDPTPEIRGLAWLLGSHLLVNEKIYRPWSIINRDEWLERVLKTFLINGLKTPGSVMDFGLGKINLRYYIKSSKDFDETKLFSPIEKVDPITKMIMFFICSMNPQSSDYKISSFFLENLLNGLVHGHLPSYSSIALVEIYFNISLLAIQKCFQNSLENKYEDETTKMIETITSLIGDLLETTLTFKDENEFYWSGQLYLCHSLFVHLTKEYFSSLSSSDLDTSSLDVNYLLFQSNMMDNCERIFLNPNPIGIFRFLTESFYKPGKYFSYDYYFTSRSSNYERNILRILKQNFELTTVRFDYNDSEIDDKVEILGQMKTYAKLFKYSLCNNDYNPTFQRSFELSLVDVMPPKFKKRVIFIINEIVKYIDSVFQQQSKNSFLSFEDYQKNYILLAHLQYILRCQNDEILSMVNNQADSDGYLRDILIKWITQINSFCGEEVQKNSSKYFVLIGSKMIEICFVVFSRCHSMEDIKQNFLSKLDPFAFCLVSRHLKCLKSLPLTEEYQKFYTEFRNGMQQVFFDDKEKLKKLISSQACLLVEKNKNYKVSVLMEMIEIITESDVFDIDLNWSLKTTFEVLDKLCYNFSNIGQKELVDDGFYFTFPSIMQQLYSKCWAIVLEVDEYQQGLIRHICLVWERMFSIASYTPMCPSEESYFYRRFCIFNEKALEFIDEIFKSLFHNYSFLSDLIIQLAVALIDMTVQKITFADPKFIILREPPSVKAFLDILIARHGDESTDSDLKKSKLEASFKIFLNIPNQIIEMFEKKSLIFEKENDYSDLRYLYLDDINNTNCHIHAFHQFNDDPLPSVAKAPNGKMELTRENLLEALKFVETNYFISVIIEILFKQNKSSFMNFDVFGVDKKESNFQQSFFKILRRLFKNFYLLENFYYFINQFDIKKTFELWEKNDQFNYSLFRKRFIDSIKMRNLKHFLKDMIHELTNFHSFTEEELINIIFHDGEPLGHSKFKFLNHLLDNFFKNSSISLLTNFKDSFDSSDIFWISLLDKSTENIIDSIHKVVEPITNVEVTENETIIKSFQSFTQLPSENVHKLLLILNIFCDRFSIIKENSDANNFLDIIKQLSLSDFPSLFKILISFPDKSKAEYKIFWLSSLLLSNCDKIIEHFGLEEFKMYTSIYEKWMQLTFTIPIDISFDRLILCTQTLKSFKKFIKLSKIWMKKHPEELAIIELLKSTFAFRSQNMLLPLFVVMNDSFHKKPLFNQFLIQLSNVLLEIDEECLKDIALLELNKSLLMLNEDSEVEQRFRSLLARVPSNKNYLQSANYYNDYILEHVTPLLLNDDYDTIFCTYHLLHTVIFSADWQPTNHQETRSSVNDNTSESNNNSELTISELNSINDNDIDESDRCLPPKILVCLLENFSTISIDDLNTQGSCAYLLVWMIYLRLLERFPYTGIESEIRLDLINYIVEKNFHVKLFENLFILIQDLDDNDVCLNEEKFQKEIELTLKKPSMDVFLYSENVQSKLFIEHDPMRICYLACFVYYQTLRHMPNAVRSWFNTLKPNQKDSVDSWTRRFFSKPLISKELSRIMTADQKQLGNIKINIQKKTNEVFAVYSLKEISFGISFEFDVNYPLTPILIKCFNKSGVSEDRCRKWIQRLTIFFNKMNCSILDGIIMIKSNMDKFFEGIEECMICLFVLLGIGGQLPRFKCPQCKKKFHTSCIRKWFRTNHNATCPQCKFEFQ